MGTEKEVAGGSGTVVVAVGGGGGMTATAGWSGGIENLRTVDEPFSHGIRPWGQEECCDDGCYRSHSASDHPPPPPYAGSSPESWWAGLGVAEELQHHSSKIVA